MTVLLWISGALCLSFLIGFWLTPWGIRDLKRRAGGAPQLDLRLSYTPDEAAQLLDLYGPAGIARFRAMLWADMIFPAAYATFFAGVGIIAARNFDGAWRWAAVALVVGAIGAALCDYAENFTLLEVLDRWPQRAPSRVRCASRFTTAKFLLSTASVVALAICAIAWRLA
ncbi:MAG: hypothetical protein ACLPSF_00625 [Methylocella sp.]